MNLENKISILKNFHCYLNKYHADKPSKLELKLSGHVDNSCCEHRTISLCGVETCSLNSLLWTMAHEHHHSQNPVWTVSDSSDDFILMIKTILSVPFFVFLWYFDVPWVWILSLLIGLQIRFYWVFNEHYRTNHLQAENDADHFANTVIGGGGSSFSNFLKFFPQEIIRIIIGRQSHPLTVFRYWNTSKFKLNQRVYQQIKELEAYN